ncbi:eukaryotic mitochondrial regulator protein-domain-containing protein [Mycena latifolia]|nr:eukaryotic mitochondrial regulator protein-domain-containing protein [Mycena latifolia]
MCTLLWSFSHARFFSMFSLGPRCPRRLCPPSSRRCISSSPPTFATPKFRKRESEEDDGDEEESEKPSGPGQTFKSFLKFYDRYRTAKPRNWITQGENESANSPFPMNPSFKPPTPISDVIRSCMYADFMMDPEQNSVRELSQRYHISLKRVDAILRLKGMEAAYVKGKTLQTGFRWGMEMLLGVKQGQEQSPDRADVHAADMLEQDENRDAVRQRFQRQFWEMIPDDGKEPLLPAALEHAKRVAERHAQAAEDHKSNPRLMPRFKDTPTIKSPRQKVQTIVRAGRLPIHFVDVGGKFIDVQERLKRLAMAERRNMFSARKSEEKVLSGYMMGRTTVERTRRAAVRREIKRERERQHDIRRFAFGTQTNATQCIFELRPSKALNLDPQT